MFYYTIDNDNNIAQYTEIKGNTIPAFLKIWNKTERKIVTTLDGKFMFADDVDQSKEQELMIRNAKSDKIYELKSKRDSLEVEPIEYNGNLFDFDEKARDRINSALIALDLMCENATIEWTTANNTNVTVTANDLRTVIANVAIRSNELHVKYRNLKERVEKCNTKEELDSIKWGDVSQTE